MDTILVCVDFSNVTDRVMAAATKLAKALEAHACLLHVVAPDPVILTAPDVLGGVGPVLGGQSVPPRDTTEVRKKLQALADGMTQAGVQASATLVQGVAAETVLSQAARIAPQWVIMGSHGHGALYHLLAGSVTTAVLRRAGVPVLVVPANKK